MDNRDHAAALGGILACLALALLLYHSLAGGTLLSANAYDSYSLQAENWLGRAQLHRRRGKLSLAGTGRLRRAVLPVLPAGTGALDAALGAVLRQRGGRALQSGHGTCGAALRGRLLCLLCPGGPAPRSGCLPDAVCQFWLQRLLALHQRRGLVHGPDAGALPGVLGAVFRPAGYPSRHRGRLPLPGAGGGLPPLLRGPAGGLAALPAGTKTPRRGSAGRSTGAAAGGGGGLLSDGLQTWPASAILWNSGTAICPNSPAQPTGSSLRCIWHPICSTCCAPSRWTATFSCILRSSTGFSSFWPSAVPAVGALRGGCPSAPGTPVRRAAAARTGLVHRAGLPAAYPADLHAPYHGRLAIRHPLSGGPLSLGSSLVPEPPGPGARVPVPGRCAARPSFSISMAPCTCCRHKKGPGRFHALSCRVLRCFGNY